MYRIGSPARLFTALALALVTLAIPARLFAQAPTFNALVSTPVTVGSGFPEDATVGDINGDGKLDAMIPGINGLRMLLGNGNGTFVDRVLGMVDVTSSNVVNLHPLLAPFLPRPVGGIGGLGDGIKAVDVNRDGKLDLVGVTTVGINFVNWSFVSVLINTGVNDADGVPQFTTTHHWMPFQGVRPVIVGDLNGDTWPDFIIGTCCNGIQVWTSNSGDGSFTPGQVFSLTPGAGGPSVGQGVITDLNGDGKADYVVSSNQNGGANIFFGNGDGTLQTPGTYLPNNAGSMAVADVNGDGRPDLVMSNQASGLEGLYVYLNNGGGTFGSPTLSPLFGGGRVAVADINGDGILDAAVSVAYNGFNNVLFSNVTVLLGDGTGVFGQPVAFQANTIPTHVFVGDFTSDGKPDIGVVLRNTRSFGVLTNTTVFIPPLPTQTLTILGGDGSPGGIAANVEYYNPATGQWQPAYLTGGHPWGFVPGTNSWINYKVGNLSDPGAGPTPNQTLWYLYRVRFTVPADALNPKMTFSLKADNFAQVAINGGTAGGTTEFINNAWMNNVVVGQADQVNVDAAFSQNVHVGENTITLNIGDWGGLNGFNFRIDLSMQSSEPIEIVPVDPDTTAPAINAPADTTAEATSAAGAVVTFNATATDDTDGAVSVVASPASGSTFPIGLTTVDLSASDQAGNTATASFSVTVQDTIAPVVSVPGNIVAEATSASGAAVSYPAPTATDVVGVTSLASNPPSGSMFAMGSTTVSATALDAAGNRGSATFTITVVDTTAPTLTIPAQLTIECAANGGVPGSSPSIQAWLASATATDLVDPSPLLTHNAPATCALGTTTVTFTATDAAGNAASATSTIRVVDTTAPTVTAALENLIHGRGDDDDNGRRFVVRFTCADGCSPGATATATINGITVTNGQVVQLVMSRGPQKVQTVGQNVLKIKAPAFELVVTCVDASGNQGRAVVRPVFPPHHDDDDHHGDDDDDDDRKKGKKDDKKDDKKGKKR